MAPERICIDCRTLLGPDERCDAGRFHRVVSLADAAGRERLRAQVWGPPELRARAAEAAKLGGLGAFLESASCGGCPAEAAGAGLEALVFVVVGFLVVVAVVGTAYWLIATLVTRIYRHFTRLRPSGVAPPLSPRRERWRGRIASGNSVSPPVGDGEGVAWAVALESSDAAGKGPRLLFAGETAGFRVELDDGGTLDVPPGRVRIADAREGWKAVPGHLARRWASTIDGRKEGDLHPPVPANRGRAIVLEIGDAIEVSAVTTQSPDGRASYRSAELARRTSGVPSLA